MDLLGLGALKETDGDSHSAEEDMGGPFEDDMPTDGMAVEGESANFPKFHINGKGETSGAAKWSKAIRQVHFLYKLWSVQDDDQGLVPPTKDFPDFTEQITWKGFLK